MSASHATSRLDTTELEQRVRTMDEEVALEPEHDFHFETGRGLVAPLGRDARAGSVRAS
jgi:arsenite methyltransferase